MYPSTSNRLLEVSHFVNKIVLRSPAEVVVQYIAPIYTFSFTSLIKNLDIVTDCRNEQELDVYVIKFSRYIFVITDHNGDSAKKSMYYVDGALGIVGTVFM